jgi:hypothetical protein
MKKFLEKKIIIYWFHCRFLGRVNDKGSAYKEFLIMTGIATHLAQVIWEFR